jgi:hypothetical protein
MNSLFSERAFFDWLQRISTLYSEALADWGQAAKSAANDGELQALLDATDRAIEQIVSGLMEIGRQHDDTSLPRQSMRVLDALDRLLGASVEFLEDARAGLRSQGLAALPRMAPRVSHLRELEEAVERATDALQERFDDTFGSAG